MGMILSREMLKDTLAERLRKLRTRLRLSQEEAAERSGISLRCYRALETGETSSPIKDTLIRISGGFDISVTHLLLDIDETVRYHKHD